MSTDIGASSKSMRARKLTRHLCWALASPASLPLAGAPELLGSPRCTCLPVDQGGGGGLERDGLAMGGVGAMGDGLTTTTTGLDARGKQACQ